MEFKYSRGNIYLTGHNINWWGIKQLHLIPKTYQINQKRRDGDDYHLTLISKEEMNILKKNDNFDLDEFIERLKSYPDIDKIYCLALGQNSGVYYQIVFWNAGNKFRNEIGLPKKDFHVTVGFKDDDNHQICKDLTTAIELDVKNKKIIFDYCDQLDDVDSKIKTLELCSQLFLDSNDNEHYEYLDRLSTLYFNKKKFAMMLDLSKDMIQLNDKNFKGYFKKGVAEYYLKDFINCFITLQRCKTLRIPKNKKDKLLHFLRNAMQNLKFSPLERLKIISDGEEVIMPRNFSFVIPGLLAGCSLPKRINQLRVFKELNIDCIYTVLDEQKIPEEYFTGLNIENIILPVKNFYPPSIEQVDQFITHTETIINQGKGVLVHCGGGKGRAGTFLACYMVKNGIDGNTDPLENCPVKMTSLEAIKYLRKIRPGSIETEMQEDFVKKYTDILWERYSTNSINSFPSINHLPFSPEVHKDDKIMSSYGFKNFIGNEVVITEKLDGGNCCIYGDHVYARTHSKGADHPSFSPIKVLHLSIKNSIDNGLMLFGENMTAIHSIEYECMTSNFYLFAVYNTYSGRWLSWDEVTSISKKINIPMAPILFRGYFTSSEELEKWCLDHIKKTSKLSRILNPEGFVIRTTNSFSKNEFMYHIGKYVKRGHIQDIKSGEWKKNWKKSKIKNINISRKDHMVNLRNKFRESVYKRDGYKCKIPGCDKQESDQCHLDAHHITDRHEMPNDGYVESNGITLCPECHVKAEHYHNSGNKESLPNFHPTDMYNLIGSSYDQALDDCYALTLQNI